MRNYGGSGDDIAYFIENTSDGGWILTGTTTSFGAGNKDVFLQKLASTGAIEWQRTYGTSGVEEIRCVRQMSDGGYVLGGKTGGNFHIFKVSSLGVIEWSRTIDGGGDDYVVNMIITSDGGIAVAGDAFTSLHYGFIARLESDGDVLWARRINNISDNDAAYGITETPDGDFLITGYTFSTGPGNGNGWRLRFNSSGTLIASHAYGRSSTSSLNGFWNITRTNDGNYIMVRNIDNVGAGGRDVWVLKTDLDGDIIWSKAYGGSGAEECYEIRNTLDNGYIITGITNSFGNGGTDVYLIKIDQDGALQWSRTFGGGADDRGHSVSVNPDGGYTIVGSTRSSPAVNADVFLIKTNASGNSIDCSFTAPATVETSFTADVLTPARAVTNMTTFATPVVGSSTLFFNPNSFCIPLPVTLQSFSGRLNGAEAVLSWAVTEEEGLSNFEIERSRDGYLFQKVGMVKAGAGEEQSVYTFTDQVLGSLVYYRLKFVGESGNVSYSKVIVVEDISDNDMVIYPNPLGDEKVLNVRIGDSNGDEVFLECWDLNGKLVFRKSGKIIGFDTFTIPVREIESGTYIISVIQNGTVLDRKVFVF